MRLRRGARRAVLLSLLPLLIMAFAGSAPAAQGGAWTLERVVLLQRHGIRSPTDSPAKLDRYSAQPWPSWPVAPGELTDAGRRALAVMAAYVRSRYTDLGLLPRAGCPAPGLIYVWADSTDERTRVSGAVMAAGLAPGCGLNSVCTEPGHTTETRMLCARSSSATE